MLHHAHARARRQRRLRSEPRAEVLRRAVRCTRLRPQERSSAWAGRNPDDDSEPFGMTVLAIKLANITNGVSKLHGEVSRKMWQSLWPELPVNEVPITLDHQRRPHAQLARPGDRPALRPLPRHPVVGEARPITAIWKRVEPSPTPSCGGRTSAAEAAGALRPQSCSKLQLIAAARVRAKSPAPTRCSTPTR